MPAQKILNRIVTKKDGVSYVYKIGNVDGYLNPTDGLFYEESTYETPIDGVEEMIYVDLPTNHLYRYDTTNSTFVIIGGTDEGGGLVYVDTLPVAPDIEDRIYGIEATYTESKTIETTCDETNLVDAGFVIQDTGILVPGPATAFTYQDTEIGEIDYDTSNFTIKDTEGTQIGDALAVDDSISLVKTTTTEGYEYYIGNAEEQSYKEVVIDSSLEFLTAADIDELMSSVAQTTWSYLAEIIVDDMISTRKTWSSNKINTMLNTTLENANQYTLEQLAHFSTASYKLASSTAEVVDRDYMYLIPISGSTDGYDIYVLVDDTPTKVGTTEVNLSNYFTKDESNARFLTIADAEANYVNKVQYDREIGDVTDLSGFTANDIVGCLNEAHTFEDTNVDWATEW